MAPKSIDDYLSYQLARAHRKMHSDLEARLQKEGVSVEQWRVLDTLGEMGGLSMGELAERVLMNHPALTKLADRMVANGLIHRVADAADQRRVLVHLTRKGGVTADRLRALAREHDREINATFGQSKSAALRALLEDLLAEPASGEDSRVASPLA